MASEENMADCIEITSDISSDGNMDENDENDFDVDYFFNSESDDDEAEEDDNEGDNDDAVAEETKRVDGVSFYFYSFEKKPYRKSCYGECRKKSDGNKDNNKLKKRPSMGEQLKLPPHIRKPLFTNFVEDENPIVDGFICCHGSYNTYAKTVRSDLETLLFSCEQISILYEHNYLIRRKIGNTLKMVATPDIIRNLSSSMKTLTLYSLVGCLPKGEIIFPVADKILRHKMSSFLESFFDEIKIHCREHKLSWPLFQRLITDVDFEVISAALSHFNQINIATYLKLCYDMHFNKKGLLKESIVMPKNLVSVQFSASHCSQLMLQEVKRWAGEKRPKLQEFLIDSLRILFNLFKVSHCIIWFRRICMVLLSPHWTKRAEDSFNALTQHPRRMDSITMNDKVAPPETLASLKKLRSACKKSPFKEQFVKYYLHSRMLCIKDNMNDSGTAMTTNLYYCPKVVKMLMDNCIAMLPFWSNIIGIKVEPNQFHTEQDEMITNFYNELRNEHTGPKRLELGQFIRGYGDFVEAQIEDLRNFY